MTLGEAFALAVQHQQSGRLAEAEAIYRQILAQTPDNTWALLNLGSTCRSLNRPQEALQLYRQALHIQPDFPEGLYNMGIALISLGRRDEAAALVERSLALAPDFILARLKRAELLSDRGEHEKALAECESILELDPSHARTHYRKGLIHTDLGQLDAAAESFKAAIATDPGFADAHINLGVMLRRLGHYDEALATYEQALKLRPGSADDFYNMGIALQSALRFDEALTAFRKTVALKPDHVGAHHLLGRLLLLRGDMVEGGREYEWRPNNHNFLTKPEGRWHIPPWDGRPLPDGTLVLMAEGGFGDAIHYIRYVPQIARMCRRIVLIYREPLRRLFTTLPDSEHLLHNPPVMPPADACAMFLSLPHLLGTRLDTIPANIPYLAAEPDLVGHWRRRLAGHAGPRIGLIWSGSDFGTEGRSTTLTQFAPLGRVPGVTFFSIQKGPPETQALTPPRGLDLVNLSPEIADFADTAAIIGNLDLVISVDTSVVHLAGAIGAPVWTLITAVPDYRWMLERRDTPWYPTMRLFRQASDERWEPVIEQVAEELAIFTMNYRRRFPVLP